MTTALPARSRQKRESIMAAAGELFLENGYRGTSVEQIAAAAAVSKQTVYKHFGDKRALLMAIVAAVVETSVQSLVGRIGGLAETSDLERDLVDLASDYLRSVLAEPVVRLRRLVVAEAIVVPELARLYYEQAPAQTLRAFADAFESLDHRGLLRVPDAPLAAEHFAFLVVGRSIDRALFFGGADTLAALDVADYARAGVRVFLAGHRV